MASITKPRADSRTRRPAFSVRPHLVYRSVCPSWSGYTAALRPASCNET